MKLSAFTFIRNADKLSYPVRESILSVLPLVDEFVIAVGDNDEGDGTIALIESINSPKIKMIHTVWDTVKFPKAQVYAQQTDFARSHCTGDWLFYIQGDEVIHEKDYANITARCSQLLGNTEIEGLLFEYFHFWGDYQHRNRSHSAYSHEIRIIRNHPDIHSFGDAQGFRRIPNFDGKNFRQKENVFKLKVARVNAGIYHYGWVRPPDFMMRKRQMSNTLHHGAETTTENFTAQLFDYGPVGRKPKFTGTHPAIMTERIAQFNWAHQLNYGKHQKKINRPLQKHEKLKYRIWSWFEINVFKRQIFTASKYEIIDI
jgi:hypothetical protein